MSFTKTPESMLEKSDHLAAAGDLAGAIAWLKQTIKTAPHFYRGWIRLSKRLHEAGYFSEAIQVGRAAEQFDPLQAEFRQVQELMQAQAFNEAERAAKRMLEKEPGHARAVFAVAEIAQIKNYPEGRVEALKLGLRHSPANIALHNMLIGALEDAGDYQGAVDEAQKLVELDESFETLWTQISILLRLGQNEPLLDACNRALKLCANDAKKTSQVELVRGQILRVLGQREEGIRAFQDCLAGNPGNAGAWWGLADLKTYKFSDQDRAAIRTLLHAPNIPQAEKCLATFALAKASEAKGDWNATMSLYHQANQLHPNADFQPESFVPAIQTQVRCFTSDSLATQALRHSEGPTPIFILGLPRSGSTLLEQILASHSQIEGTVEQPVLPSIKRKAHVHCALKFRGTYLDNHGDLSAQDLSDLAAAYLSDGALFRSEDTPFFTDKLPFNFLHIGLIHKLFPNAPIIDARRHPLDCGFSLYRQYFVTGSKFSYDLEHIGVFYKGYLELMDHWDAILPGRVFRVQHESLVANPDEEIRRLLDHIGVKFEPACLNFHQTNRAVRTASSEQVRRPINRDGIGAWRRVDSHLGPLKNSLGPETLARFEPFLDPS